MTEDTYDTHTLRGYKGGWYDLQKAEVYARRLNEFCARIGLSSDVPHDVSIGCARDTD